MQTTLLGLAIALILALVAALVGPLLIDWGTYRALFEQEASRVVGADVRVTGTIDARLLPSPRLTLHGVVIGTGQDKVRARSLGIEFALGPLMRGEWRAAEMHLAGPELSLGLDETGHVRAPTIAVAFDPDALSIERLGIEDGKLTLSDAANGASITFDRFWFNGEARSLLGPFKGEGAVTIGGELYPYRIAAGRYGEDGALKLRLHVDPVNRPLSIEVDGALALAGGVPRFDGSVNMARPVGIAGRGGAQAGQTVTPPWRVSGKIKAAAQSALMENIEFVYGSEEQGLKLTGVADFSFGKRPRFNGVLSGRQIDLDRVLVSGDGSRPPPAAALRQLAELGGAAFSPAIPIHVGIGIDQVTLGGGAVQNVRGDISSSAGGWNLDRFEFRAPGFTQVRMSGRLAVDPGGVAFTGPAEIEAGDPKVLTAWLEGRGDTGQGDPRPLRLRGEITLASDKIAVERLNAEFERKSVAGRFAYAFAVGSRPAKLDAVLNAPELDIDAALGFGKALLAGSKLERPRDMTISADIGRATVAGFTARNASARLKVDGDGLQIDRLSVADLGGAAFSASGRIVTGAPSPQGSMRVDLDAPDLTPVVALLSRFAPGAAEALEPRAAAMAPAKLHAQFTLDGVAPAMQGKLTVDGSLGKVRVALNGQGRVDAVALTAGAIDLDGKLEADDGKVLMAVLGLDRLVNVGSGRGGLSFAATGPAHGEMRVEGKLTAGGLEANASGTARLLADKPTAALHAAIVRADAAPLRGAAARRAALPVTYAGRIALAGKELTLSDISATVDGASLRGKLALTLAKPNRLQGEIEADNVDGAGLVAAAIGMPDAAGNASAAWSWSSEPFAANAFGAFAGQVALKARRVALLPQLTAREFRATMRLGNNEIAFEDMSGEVAGGQFAGRLSFRAADDGVKAQAKFSLSGADAASVLSSGARPPVAGKLGLTAEVEGTGLSPVALIGSLQGAGKITLADGQFAALDPRAFDAVTRAVDHGLTIDAARISDVVRKALASGQLSVKRAQGMIGVSAGQVRLSNAGAESRDAALALSGNLDLTDGFIDARLVLSGKSEPGGARPDIYMALKGPVTAPSRSIDVSALTGWLTLRAVETQAKKLQAIERAAKQSPPPSAQALPAQTSPPIAPVRPTPVPPAAEGAAAQTPASQRGMAPVLPAPVLVGPLPVPAGIAPPNASVGSQN